MAPPTEFGVVRLSVLLPTALGSCLPFQSFSNLISYVETLGPGEIYFSVPKGIPLDLISGAFPVAPVPCGLLSQPRVHTAPPLSGVAPGGAGPRLLALVWFVFPAFHV